MCALTHFTQVPNFACVHGCVYQCVCVSIYVYRLRPRAVVGRPTGPARRPPAAARRRPPPPAYASDERELGNYSIIISKIKSRRDRRAAPPSRPAARRLPCSSIPSSPYVAESVGPPVGRSSQVATGG
ncbi:hypothetical protein EVAR_35268_1 [Eumeta japonica]|uniref:Uncharacterized protein n=1 Tax=Eumeta variegata TaxID=151549 RepID=A0A4C1VEJ6_EUMVA|nr:hypothetical protein EVAR_35268_1 [Eumeta japonica]